MSDHSTSKANQNNQQEKISDSLYFHFLLFHVACMVVSASVINFSIFEMAELLNIYSVGILLVGLLAFLINGHMLIRVILLRRAS